MLKIKRTFNCGNVILWAGSLVNICVIKSFSSLVTSGWVGNCKSSLLIFSYTATTDDARNGTFPYTNEYNVVPKAQISVAFPLYEC